MIEFAAKAPLFLASFVFVFSLVVFIHELGHFLVARWCGVRVETFSIGFGKTLASWRAPSGTVWRIAALPLGGYVKFFGDAGAASNPDPEKLAELRRAIDDEHGEGTASQCFHFKPVWQRALIVAAGPVANFILAIAIFGGILGLVGEREVTPRVGEVVEGSPAEEAGFAPGDLIVAAEGREIRSFRDVQRFVLLRRGDDVVFEVERDGAPVSLEARIGETMLEDGAGRTTPVGYLGLAAAGGADSVTFIRHNPVEAVVRGVEETWFLVGATGHYVARIFTGRENAEQLGGPLRIFDMAGQTTEQAIVVTAELTTGQRALVIIGSLLEFAALLSVGIGLLNLLPIPILDGGHLVYYAYEAVMRRPLGEAAQEWGFRVGLALVLGLMAFVTFNDVRYFGWFKALTGS